MELMDTNDRESSGDGIESSRERGEEGESGGAAARERRGVRPLSRRAALAVLGVGGVGALGIGRTGARQSRPTGRPWNGDVDARGNCLLNLGCLAMARNPARITDFEGPGLRIDSRGVLSVTVADTRTLVSDSDGSPDDVEASDVTFGTNLSVTDNGNGQVRVDAVGASPWTDADGDTLLELAAFDGVDVDTVVADAVETPLVGTRTATPFEVVVEDERVLLVERGRDEDSPNVVAGSASNTAFDDGGSTVGGGGTQFDPNRAGPFGTVGGGRGNVATARFATVGGGSGNTASSSARGPTVAGGENNTATDQHATVGGGQSNRAESGHDTVAGGQNNEASGGNATVAGGNSNTAGGSGAAVGGGVLHSATGDHATIPGGERNTAAGNYSFAAGLTANAADDNAFVWNDGSQYHDVDGDGTPDGFSSAQDVAGSGVTGEETFNVSASGGVRFVTGPNSVTYVPGGSTGWSTTSTVAAKTDVTPVDPRAVLDGVLDAPVSTWEYVDENGEGRGVRHIGPMAETFHRIVDVGDSDAHINSVDADGVALAAIQGLAARLDETAEELRSELAARDEHVETLAAENDRLRERLRAVEDATPDDGGA
ncbi:tail fiber domain-containing protein [Halomarina oriensis]|uniref:Peptidase S74 domain-containing protein n=1 Tax=Halomarina oriensis TaxID=671145 RepID=A0A6B0GPQ5_9EURY|nr:hypothetical protein [Halomarina oriensis]MWG36001.1 hypothetical protein [Halomarina oriensis]